MALRVRVCRTDEVAPGETRAFSVSGIDVPILVANLDGEFLAATSMCPHEDVSLTGGEREGSSITCPGHGYQFDLKTGACEHDPDLILRTYRVSVLGTELYVDLL